MNRQIRVLVAVAFLLSCNALFARAEAASTPPYPVKPIRFIVPYPRGGTTDAFTRFIRTDIALPRKSLRQPTSINRVIGYELQRVGMTRVVHPRLSRCRYQLYIAR